MSREPSGKGRVKPGYKRLNFDMSVDLHQKLKVYCAMHGMTMKDVLIEYVSELKNLQLTDGMGNNEQSN